MIPTITRQSTYLMTRHTVGLQCPRDSISIALQAAGLQSESVWSSDRLGFKPCPNDLCELDEMRLIARHQVVNANVVGLRGKGTHSVVAIVYARTYSATHLDAPIKQEIETSEECVDIAKVDEGQQAVNGGDQWAPTHSMSGVRPG